MVGDPSARLGLVSRPKFMPFWVVAWSRRIGEFVGTAISKTEPTGSSGPLIIEVVHDSFCLAGLCGLPVLLFKACLAAKALKPRTY